MIDAVLPLLRCPLCRGTLARRESSLVCPAGHCFNIARQGYADLAPNKRDRFYSKPLFLSRAAAFSAGLFSPVVDALTDALDARLGASRPVIVDAGCGEGYYLKRVCPGRTLARVGFDLSRDAVRMAAAGEREAAFFAADLAAIPLADGCADAVLDVFSPANYREFARIMRPGGVLVKLAPRAGYLKELREAAGPLLRRREYDGEAVDAHLRAHAQILEQRTITYAREVTPELAAHVARMTPMLARVDLAALDLSRVTSVTIDETLTVARLDPRDAEQE